MTCYKRCYLRQWARDVSDLHGVKHVAGDGGVLRRLIWLVATVTATTLFMQQAALTFIRYYEWRHVNKVDISYTSELPFPAFTICNSNKYRESLLTDRDIKNVGVHLGEFVCVSGASLNKC